MPGTFHENIENLQKLKKSNPNGVSKEQYMDMLYELIAKSEVVRYYNEEEKRSYVPFWKTMESPDNVKESILDKAKDGKGISILCKSELDGDPFIITLDKKGNLTDISDDPVPVEEAMRRVKGVNKPEKPTVGDYLHHWFKNSFFAGLFWKKDRVDAVKAYERYGKELEETKTHFGYTPDFEIQQKKEAEEKEAERLAGIYEDLVDADEIEPDLSEKAPLSTEVSGEVQANALTASPVCKYLTPTKLGYQATANEESAMVANMPGLDKFAKPENLSDPRLSDDWQAYAEFSTKVVDVCNNDNTIVGLIDGMSKDGSLKMLYGAFKTRYFKHKTIDLESVLGEAVHHAGQVDIKDHVFKGSTYNQVLSMKPKANQNQNQNQKKIHKSGLGGV